MGRAHPRRRGLGCRSAPLFLTQWRVLRLCWWMRARQDMLISGSPRLLRVGFFKGATGSSRDMSTALRALAQGWRCHLRDGGVTIRGACAILEGVPCRSFHQHPSCRRRETVLHGHDGSQSMPRRAKQINPNKFYPGDRVKWGYRRGWRGMTWRTPASIFTDVCALPLAIYQKASH